MELVEQRSATSIASGRDQFEFRPGVGRADHRLALDHTHRECDCYLSTAGRTEMNELEDLIAQANAACRNGESTRDYEPELATLVDYIKAHPNLAEEAAAILSAGAVSCSLEEEVVSFCTHELKYPEVRAACSAVLAGSPGPGMRQRMFAILESFEADWDDAVLYSYWGR